MKKNKWLFDRFNTILDLKLRCDIIYFALLEGVDKKE